VCIAVNYWYVSANGLFTPLIAYSNRYDMEYTGPLYPLSTFVRSVAKNHKDK
jgi:hypothetical protein